MPVYAAFLRAVNVGGTGKLPMSELRGLCEKAGFTQAVTYIQSGNVVFSTRLGKARTQQLLESALAEKMGKPIGVYLRTPEELEAVIQQNPYPRAEPARLLILFMGSAPPGNALKDVEIPGGEELTLSGAELYIHFPDGMGRSKLKIPFAKTATGRNLNTVVKMLELCRATG